LSPFRSGILGLNKTGVIEATQATALKFSASYVGGPENKPTQKQLK